jgi:hypothetical protein
MSRFTRTAGSTGGGAYGDSNVCGVLSSYTGALSAGDGTNICCIRSEWELICECNCIDVCYGSCVEFTFPSTADADTCKFTAYKLQVDGLYLPGTTAVELFMKIGSATCYCTCCAGVARCYNNSTVATSGYNQAICFHCLPASAFSGWTGGNFEVCVGRYPFVVSGGGAGGFGICFNSITSPSCCTFYVEGKENCAARTSWEQFCKIALNHAGGTCAVCHCGSFRIYGQRMRPTAYSGYTIA